MYITLRIYTIHSKRQLIIVQSMVSWSRMSKYPVREIMVYQESCYGLEEWLQFNLHIRKSQIKTTLGYKIENITEFASVGHMVCVESYSQLLHYITLSWTTELCFESQFQYTKCGRGSEVKLSLLHSSSSTGFLLFCFITNVSVILSFLTSFIKHHIITALILILRECQQNFQAIVYVLK